jgi:ABC-type molybdate transport system substrate-binding protein
MRAAALRTRSAYASAAGHVHCDYRSAANGDGCALHLSRHGKEENTSMSNALTLYAAGSLRGALKEVAAAFTQQYSVSVHAVFGPSGLLRERLEAGEHADLFASADLGHPARLRAAGRAGPLVLFARNRVCALVAPGIAVSSHTLLDRLLDPSLTLGTATPIADPLGDYTWAAFERAEALRPGSFAVLTAKARRLIGGGSMPQIPAGYSALAYFLQEGKQTDIFLAYYSICQETLRVAPALQVVELPAELAVGAEFGLTVLADASPVAATLALFILAQEGQAILADHGFDAPLLIEAPTRP